MSEIEKLKSQLTRIKSERDLYRVALEYYGDGGCWNSETIASGDYLSINDSDAGIGKFKIDFDNKTSDLRVGGRRAREALEQGTKISNNEGESRG